MPRMPENILRAGVKLALHGKPHDEHGEDGDGEQRAANPLAEQEMTGAGTSHPAMRGR